MDIYPVEIRYGIGVGQITTNINTDMALGADEPGFYNARKAIDLAVNTRPTAENCWIEMNIIIMILSRVPICRPTLLSFTFCISPVRHSKEQSSHPP